MKFQLSTLSLLSLLSTVVDGCTVFIAGKDATIDGSVLVSHSNDGEFTTDPRLVKVPAADYAPNSQRPIYFSPEEYPRYVGTERNVPEYFPKEGQKSFEPIGYIPQVSHTYAYLEQTYGAINEKQVAIGESTCSGVFGAVPLGHPDGTALLSIDELSKIAMERASTARSAVEIMGALAEEYGFYGAGSFEGTAESLGVTDTNEAYIFHILPDPTGKSAIWTAQRVPDHHFAVLANIFVIREVDPSDTDNFLMSKSVHDVAMDKGWWDPNDGKLLDFTGIYSDGESSHKFYNGRRMWRSYDLVAPSLSLPYDYEDLKIYSPYPVSLEPEYKLSVYNLTTMHRDTYQGTQFDLGAEGNMAGGPFGNPDRNHESMNEKEVGGNWERSIGLYRTSDSYVCRSSDDDASTALGGFIFFGPASALGTVYTPFFVNMEDIPTTFRSAHHSQFDRTSMFWAAVYVHNISNLKRSYAIKDVTDLQDRLEGKSMDLVKDVKNSFVNYEMLKKATSKATNLRTDDATSYKIYLKMAQDAFLQNAAECTTSLWSLSDKILFKYASGYVNEPAHMSVSVGYPKWWLEAVGFKDGPPPVPHKPKFDDEALSKTGKAVMKEYMKQNEGQEF
eukprot:CAMPEP_0185726802 /NCGR_PEP_ID=MMETSP1171-20130828/2673_1 /TAXON_ID=374046 /ORGANISM="Helicotheca tamensis, Strain CCMP826" /LENGTH=615 /DNA_ID=CAMNT_0028395223 /DNA_START=115 /DNA_END=1962 /DNA_ORIENTATION=-